MSDSLPATGPRFSAAQIMFDVLAAAAATPAQIAERQARRLVQLLQAARATRFYAQALQGLELPGLPLTALPVTGKPDLMRNFADRVSDPALTLAGLRTLCTDAQRIGEHYLGRYWVWESSGSTGEPGVFVQDAAAMAVYDALEATRRHSPRPWARLLDPMFLTERFAFVGAIDGHFASHVSVQRLRAAQPWLAPRWRSFSILQPAPALVAQLNDYRPTIVASYPTAAALLADQARLGRLHIAPQEIWTGGEMLPPGMRKHIEQSLGGTLRSSYGASEFLPIAWECGHGNLHVNADWVILEPVDEALQPVPPGQVSHTTLVTNLANHVQPLIRFDIGDRVLIEPARCRCGSALPVLQVQGRRDDVLVVPGHDGVPVSLLPLALTTVLEDDAGVFDFQLCQRGPRRWCLTLGPGHPPAPGLRERCRQMLAAFAAAQGAVGLRIEVRHAAALPPEHSGKRKRVLALAAAAAEAA